MEAWEISRSFLYGCAAGLLMGGAAYALFHYVLGSVGLIFRLAISILAGIFLFFAFSKIFKIKEYEFFVGALIKRKLLQ